MYKNLLILFLFGFVHLISLFAFCETEMEGLKLDHRFLKFKPSANEVKIEAPQFEYAIDKTPDVDMQFGETIINSKTVQAYMGPLNLIIDQSKAPTLAADTSFILFFMTPKGLSDSGTVELVAESGDILWSKSIDPSDLLSGQGFGANIDPNYFNISSDLAQNGFFAGEDIHLLKPPEGLIANLMDPDRKSGFRICTINNMEPYFSHFCTPYMRYSQRFKALKTQTQISNSSVFLDNNIAEQKAKINLNVESKLRFLATSTNGFTYEFYTQVLPLYLTDFFTGQTENLIYFYGHTNIPIHSQVKVFPFLELDSWTTKLYWDQTIGDLRTYWVVPVGKSNSKIVLKGTSGGFFNYPLLISQAPKKSDRILLNEPLLKNTYSENPILAGVAPATLNLTTATLSILERTPESGDFKWTMTLGDQSEEHEDYIAFVNPDDKAKEFKAYYGVYRGFAREFSLRLVTTVSTDLQFNFFPELSYNHWFENILNWENYYLSQQRWGLSLKYSQPYKNFVPKTAPNSKLNLKLTTLDLKYRLTPGIWERDETWGGILSMQDSNLETAQAVFSGLGFFWGRSMPRIFDTIVSWFPYMNYPKWVDMEFIYYSQSSNQKIVTGSSPNAAINFHGKVLWTKNIFGEAGFGLKTYDYKLPNKQIQLRTFHGTLGLGINF